MCWLHKHLVEPPVAAITVSGFQVFWDMSLSVSHIKTPFPPPPPPPPFLPTSCISKELQHIQNFTETVNQNQLWFIQL